MTAIDPETLEIARQEAADCVVKIEGNLLALERGGDEPGLINALFRDAHSVKGAAGMVGWRRVASIAGEIEDQLESAREQGRMAKELIEPLLRTTDDLQLAVTSAGSTSSEPAVDAPRPVMRVDAVKVDRMLDAVGETILHRRRLEHIVGGQLAESEDAEQELDRGKRLIDELQDAVIEMRTLPLSSITAPFPRAVRDLAATEGKEAELVISGAETQLDRVILEGISEPIVHLLRNSIAHGLESPEERARAGKPRRGRVDLRAGQQGGMVAIEVADDGRGVPTEMLSRAAEGGSLADLLTTAGVSSALEVGDLAGRGVGLDAVKVHVEGLGGSIEVRSEPGRGTEIVLLVPMTLALLNVLLCERDGRPFGLPVPSVREIVTVGETASLAGQACIEHRGEAISLGDLAVLIGSSAPPLTRHPPAIVLASATRTVAVACDRVLGDRELVVKSLGPMLSGVEGYLGSGILEDGRVALILDPNRLLDASPSASPPAFAAGAERPAPKVLVVDDQFSVRRLQRSILEAAGYRVEVARNGLEALQMPEMDGVELLEAVRRDEALRSLPVAIVTSRGSAEERQLGAEKGADAYIVKNEFDQGALLETIDRLIGR
jgi:two-component system chemotaxis sensor kinase CheA